MNSVVDFSNRIESHSITLSRRLLDTLQINLGKLCNQVCTHCHVGAGPAKTRENMNLPTAKRLLELAEKTPSIKTVDMTGGAPELNPHFRMLVREFGRMDVQIIDRCNLTVLSLPGQEDTVDFLAQNNVKIVASMPCYSQENVDKQRGVGVFEQSIEGLRVLNSAGYGQAHSSLELDLVYNPAGAFLPPPQLELKAQYTKQLDEDFGIKFNDLYCITNLPVLRFRDELERTGQLSDYMKVLSDSFNSNAAEAVMCRTMVSVSWDGKIYDCDFNQMLGMPIDQKNRTVHDINSFEEIQKSNISFANHCYGCTAGAGSSCGGTTVN